jgi:ketol-acid reductoisomerase
MLRLLSRQSVRPATALGSRRGLAAMPLHPEKKFSSKFFNVEEVMFADQKEQIVRGGRNLFPKLPAALAGVKQIGVIGWGSQGPAQAQNMRESLEGSGIKVKIGLREGSSSMKAARACGFTEETGTLGEMYKTISESDMVLLLISDAACIDEYKNVFKALKPKATLGLSHGFLLGHLEAIGEKFPPNVDVVLCAPKGMGPSVRRLYEQGRTVNGSGINASFGVHQDATGHATERALAWAVGVGSPYIFQTTLNAEWRSDIFGERCILLGGVHGMIESLFRYYEAHGMSAADAFKQSGEVITGPITHTISHDGIRAVYEKLAPADQAIFKTAYSAAYLPSRSIIEECYDSVSSGNEIRDVVMAARRFDKYPMGCIDNTRTWQVGATVRKAGGTPEQRKQIALNPTTAGVYCAMMMVRALAPGVCPAFVKMEQGRLAARRARPGSDLSPVARAPTNASSLAPSVASSRAGPDRLPLRPRARLLRDRQRVGHRVGRLAQPVHARTRRLLHGRQLLGHRAARQPQVGAALRLHPDGAGLPGDRRQDAARREALQELPHPPGPRDAQDVLEPAAVRRYLRQLGVRTVHSGAERCAERGGAQQVDGSAGRRPRRTPGGGRAAGAGPTFVPIIRRAFIGDRETGVQHPRRLETVPARHAPSLVLTPKHFHISGVAPPVGRLVSAQSLRVARRLSIVRGRGHRGDPVSVELNLC